MPVLRDAIKTLSGSLFWEERSMLKVTKIATGLFVSLALTVNARAIDSYPSRPIELIVHRSGGSTWAGGRIIADALSRALNSPVVVVPKPAGAGTVAPAYVAHAAPDGYTLFVVNSGTNGTTPVILNVPYKNNDFDYYALYGTQPMVLVVRADSPFKTLRDLVETAKQRPGRLFYSTSSFGAQSHFVMEWLKLSAGHLKIDQVPYKSAPESVAGLLGGFVDVASTYLSDVKGQVDAGSLRILAVPEVKRLAEYPDVPTIAESGYPDVISTAWFGIGAPKSVPKPIADKLKSELDKVIHEPDVEKQLTTIGYTPVYMDSAKLTQFVNDQEAIFARIAKEADIKPVE
jgi:tripartite-type tricarboxylate transporter receptor subunit TctC